MVDLNTKPMRTAAERLAKALEGMDLCELIAAQLAMDKEIAKVWPDRKVESYGAYLENDGAQHDAPRFWVLVVNWQNADCAYIECRDPGHVGYATRRVASEVQVDRPVSAF